MELRMTDPRPFADNGAVNDNAPITALEDEIKAHLSTEHLEAVVGTAVLVATAFRLRDEDALVMTLRRLADAVDALEAEAEAAAETPAGQRQAACG
jgi:hypothetical protein